MQFTIDELGINEGPGRLPEDLVPQIKVAGLHPFHKRHQFIELTDLNKLLTGNLLRNLQLL